MNDEEPALQQMHRLLQEDNPYLDEQTAFEDQSKLTSVRRNRNNPDFIGSKLVSARSGKSNASNDDSRI